MLMGVDDHTEGARQRRNTVGCHVHPCLLPKLATMQPPKIAPTPAVSHTTRSMFIHTHLSSIGFYEAESIEQVPRTSFF